MDGTSRLTLHIKIYNTIIAPQLTSHIFLTPKHAAIPRRLILGVDINYVQSILTQQPLSILSLTISTILNKAAFMHTEIVMYWYWYSRYSYLLMELLTTFRWSNWTIRHLPIILSALNTLFSEVWTSEYGTEGAGKKICKCRDERGHGRT